VALVTTLDLFSLYGARRLLSAVDGPRRGRSRVVINGTGRPELGRGDVERLLGVRPVAAIRFDAAVKRAQARGQLLHPKSRRAGRDVAKLAALLARDDRVAGNG
jgi:Flp pilus assembly CpaE family ATPase